MANLTLTEASREQELAAQRILRLDPDCGFSEIRSDALDEGERCYVILHGKEVVGFYSFRWVSRQIFYFFVAPAWRKKGIGTQALGQLIVELRGRGVDHVVVNMTPGSEPFWYAAFRDFEIRNEWSNRYRFDITKNSSASEP